MAKPVKKKVVPEWVFDREIAAEATKNAVHFVFKLVNTNSEPGGIRIGANRASDLPYVFGRRYIDKIGLDYVYGGAAGGDAAGVRSIYAALDPESAAPASDRQFVREELLPLMKGDLLLGGEFVPSRLRQILLPRGEGCVAVTPLPCPGVAEILNGAIRQHNAQEGVLNKLNIRRAQASVGGTKPQNAGRMAQHMCSPMFFGAPKSPGDAREAFAIYHRGISLDIPGVLIREYANKRREWLRKDGSVDTNAVIREDERSVFRRIAQAILRRGQLAAKLLDYHRARVGDGLGKDVDPLVAAIILPERREKEWARELAVRLARGVLDHRVRVGGELVRALPEFGDAEMLLIANCIEMEIR